MALIRWEPIQGVARRWIPAMDLVDGGDHFELRLDLPGLSENDVNIELEDDLLTISGERKSEHQEKKAGYYRVERSYGSFTRSLKLPEGVDPDAVKATFDRGVLEVRIPKPEERKPRKVAISVGAEAPAIEGSETKE
jgi:HSP20 family protein